MDFYANASLGSWTVNNEVNRQATVSRRKKHLQTEKLTSEEKGANVERKDDCVENTAIVVVNVIKKIHRS